MAGSVRTVETPARALEWLTAFADVWIHAEIVGRTTDGRRILTVPDAAWDRITALTLEDTL